MEKQRALVVAPGRGTYNKEEFGYLHRYHSHKTGLLAEFDALRQDAGQPTLTELDATGRYSMSRHGRGDNASALIHACALADFHSINRDKFDVVAITGNSMGWYIALAAGGALNQPDGFRLVNTMGTLMHEAMIGGQMLYPVVDDDWREIPGKQAEILALIDATDGLYLSIDLGGMLVLAGTPDALAEAERHLPPTGGRFPMRLSNHAAFHSPLQAPVATQGQAALPAGMFGQPQLPLIDGRGQIWFPLMTDPGDLRDYTLGHQVIAPYDFSRAVRNGMFEFAPDVVIILGPGRTLGGAVAQSLIGCGWQGLDSKTGFQERNRKAPIILSMGIEEQRELVVGG